MESTIYVKPERIRQYVIDLFGHYHVSKADAAMIADNLIDAEIRGVTTHGLTRIPLYTEKLISGLCDAKAVPEIVKNYGCPPPAEIEALLLKQGGAYQSPDPFNASVCGPPPRSGRKQRSETASDCQLTLFPLC